MFGKSQIVIATRDFLENEKNQCIYVRCFNDVWIQRFIEYLFVNIKNAQNLSGFPLKYEKTVLSQYYWQRHNNNKQHPLLINNTLLYSLKYPFVWTIEFSMQSLREGKDVSKKTNKANFQGLSSTNSWFCWCNFIQRINYWLILCINLNMDRESHTLYETSYMHVVSVWLVAPSLSWKYLIIETTSSQENQNKTPMKNSRTGWSSKLP